MLRHASTVLCAHEASVSMYAVDAAGLPVVGDPLWPGGCAQRIALRSSLATDRFAATGASHAKTYHLDEMHEVRFDRLWVLRDTGEDFSLRRGQELVLDIQWQDAEPKAPAAVLWHRCVFRGVKSLSHDRASEGLDEFGASQVFTAERVETTYGTGMVPAAATHQMLYLREGPASEGAWLTGAWAWAVPCGLTSVLLQAGRAGSSDTVFALDLSGADSGLRLTLPAGETRVLLPLSSDVPAGVRQRWRVVQAAEDPVEAPGFISLSVGVRFWQ